MISKRNGNGLSSRWVSHWFARDTGHALALYRILFGIYLFWFFARFLNVSDLVFSSQGVHCNRIGLDLSLPPLGAKLALLAYLGILTCFILGFVTRILTPLVLAGFVYFDVLSLAVWSGIFEKINLLQLVLCCFVDLDRVWSLTSTFRPKAASHRSTLIWYPRLVRFHMSCLYFGTGLCKLLTPEWRSGESLKNTLISEWATRWAVAFTRMDWAPSVYAAGSWLTIGFELFVFIFLWWKKSRLMAFGSVAAFHLSVAAMMAIPEFLTCVPLCVLFWKGTEIRDAWTPWLNRIQSLCFGASKLQKT